MKRFSLLFTAALLAVSCAAAESNIVFAPQSATLASSEPASVKSDTPYIDFTANIPEDPFATPVAVDPIDKPTPTPMPEPTYAYENFTADEMNVSFSIPFTWLLNPATNQATTLQFVEPLGEMMDQNGYQTRLTIEKRDMGLTQTASDARSQLENVLIELENSFTAFNPGDIASYTVSGANGYYCYYSAEYTSGDKTYQMRGRIVIVAEGKSLYQIRITTPRNWYSYYEPVWRKVKNTFKFL